MNRLKGARGERKRGRRRVRMADVRRGRVERWCTAAMEMVKS
jgi:hypothetical protein